MLTIVDHPCVKTALTTLRDRDTPAAVFRDATHRVTTFLLAEALKSLPLAPCTVQTPLAPAPGWRFATDIILVPILRAGLGMLEAARDLLPEARVGFIGLRRDEKTAIAHQYYENIPSGAANVILLDPMLATGGSMADAATFLKARQHHAITAVSIVAAPEGVERMASEHPDIPVYTGALDERLTPNKYILPGLGDAGDRLFATPNA